MTKRILIILGHPAHERQSFCEVLALAYQKAAQEAGHEAQLLNIAQLDLIQSFMKATKAIRRLSQISPRHRVKFSGRNIWSSFIPSGCISIPALLKGFFERTFTQGFAYALKSGNPFDRGLLKGKSARLIQTMGMPSLMYRFFFMEHGAKALRSTLSFCGICPVNITYFGMIEGSDSLRKRYIEKAQALGRVGI